MGLDLMLYVKVDVSLSKVGDEIYCGFGYGVGVKYVVLSNIEVGVEYICNNLKCSGIKFKGNDFSVNVGYCF